MKILGKHLLVLDPGERRRVVAIALSFIFISIAVPIGLSIFISYEEGLQSEKNRALNYASDALKRTETTTDQIALAFERLKRLPSLNPCSSDHLSLMRQLDLASSYIQAIGHVEGNMLVCSSLGTELRGVDLGPVELVQPSGARIRTSVRFPFAADERFIVVERDAYAAIIHRDLPIDATTDVEGVSFAILSNATEFVLTSRGALKDSWLQPLPAGASKTILDDDYVVAITSSRRHLLQSVAAVPSRYLRFRLEKYALLMIPVGFLVAGATGGAAFILAKRRTSMRAVIDSALRRNEFFLEYQPIVDLRTGQWVGAEALIRWRRTKGEVVAPDRFIPLVEEHGLSQWVSRRVVEIVAAQARYFFHEFPDFHLAINLTAADLHDESTVELLRDLAAATGARRGNLTVEATERFMTEVDAANRTVRALRKDGVSVAIDDFGTGYSSLSYLEQLEVDTLKIDKSFVDTLNRQAVTSDVVLHIIEMARALEKDMVAEGVESQTQADQLRELGVQYAQGWLFSRPIPFADLIAHLRREGG